MNLRIIFRDQYLITAVMNRANCNLEDVLFNEGDDGYLSNRVSLSEQLNRLSVNGFNAEGFYSKNVNRKHGIYELKAGDLRLLYFKGDHPNIIICTDLHIKKGSKVNSQAVDKSIRLKDEYYRSLKNGEINITEG